MYKGSLKNSSPKDVKSSQSEKVERIKDFSFTSKKPEKMKEIKFQLSF